MYYRHKLILSLLSGLAAPLGSTRLQKMMFLFSQKQGQAAYDFVPYKYGGFSFQLRQDVRTLHRQGLLLQGRNESGTYWEASGMLRDYTLKAVDQQAMQETISEFGALSRRELIRYTYEHAPYHAINSHIAKALLSEEALTRIEAARPDTSRPASPQLYTIGYEGISLDTYLNRLIQRGIVLLCDVRKNAFSMKWGFSRADLQSGCEAVGIAYQHMPALGIASKHRKSLRTQADRERLFDYYVHDTLPDQEEAIGHLIDLLHGHRRIAITCFERDVCQCHRGKLAAEIAQRLDLQPIHL